MDSKTKLALLIICYAIGVVIACMSFFAFGETEEFDWRFWLGAIPQVMVWLVFGFLACGWKQVIGFSLTTTLIDIIFVVSILCFMPEFYSETIMLYSYSTVLFLISVAVMMIIFSAIFLSFGFMARRLITWVSFNRLSRNEI